MAAYYARRSAELMTSLKERYRRELTRYNDSDVHTMRPFTP